MSLFDGMEQLPPDPIMGLRVAFERDERPNKVNLGIGAYRDGAGKPYPLSCVKKVESQLIDQKLNKEYLPILGDPLYRKLVLQLIFGQEADLSRVVSAQALGGTGALRSIGEFLVHHLGETLYVPTPTWPNHKPIFSGSGLQVVSYPYYDTRTHCIDFSRLLEAIDKMKPRTAVLFHACCHNPTGTDLTKEQWKELLDRVQKRRLFPLFDAAYHGLGDGLEEDLFAVRLFAEAGCEMGVAYSLSKNCGLYGERVGLIALLFQDAALIPKAESQLSALIRSNYSNPPLQGERIVAELLRSSSLKAEWKEELESMRQRIHAMRQGLVSSLGGEAFAHLAQQKGMFGYIGLTDDQVESLRRDHAIYVAGKGRINLAGLREEIIDPVAKALLSI